MNELRRINLLPKQVKKQRSGRQAKVAAIGLNVLLVVGLVLALVAKNSEVSSAEGELSAQQRTNETLQRQIADPELQEVVEKQGRLGQLLGVLQTELGNEVSVPRLLNEIQVLTPDFVQIDSIAINAAGSDPLSGLLGTVAIESKGLCGHADAAELIRRLRALDSVAQPWSPNATKTDGTNCETTSFSTTGELTTSLLTLRARQVLSGEVPQ